MPYATRWAAAALFAGALLLSACYPVQPGGSVPAPASGGTVPAPAPEGGTVPAPAGEAPATGDPAAVVQAFWDAFNTRDLDAAMELVTDDAVFQSFPGLFVGRDEVRQYLDIVSGWGMTVSPGEPQVDGDTLTVTDKVYFGDFSFPGEVIITLRDGRIAFIRDPGGDDALDLLDAEEPPAALTLDASAAASLQPGQHAYATEVEYTDDQGQAQSEPIRYLLYLPPEYGQDPAQQWPLILYMHGMGEHGSHLGVLKRHPLPEMLDGQQDLPAIVVSPQAPVYPVYREYWWESAGPIFALLDQLQAALPVGRERVYATGLSYGGGGTWELGSMQPDRFAALAPIAGFYYRNEAGVPENICDLAAMPIWAHHSAQDEAISEADEAKIVAALEKCGGGNVQYTVFPEGNHESSWRTTYADPAFWEWLFAQSK